MKYIYLVCCDDERCYITGNQPIADLPAAVQKALSVLADEQIVKPKDDWFYAVLNELCRQTGFEFLKESGSLNIEDMYWTELGKREAAQA